MIFVVHRRGLVRGDQVALDLARRWAKVSAVLFAIGAVSGTVLSFEMGLLWPGLMGRFGDVLGLPFAFEGISFFVEAIFLGIYLYGWDRLPPRRHLAMLVPMGARRGRRHVLRRQRQRLDEQPDRLPDRRRRRDRREPVAGDVQPTASGCSSRTCGSARSCSSASSSPACTPRGCCAAGATQHHRLGFTVPFAFATRRGPAPAVDRPRARAAGRRSTSRPSSRRSSWP